MAFGEFFMRDTAGSPERARYNVATYHGASHKTGSIYCFEHICMYTHVAVFSLRSFPCFALRILTAHNLWRHFARARARAH